MSIYKQPIIVLLPKYSEPSRHNPHIEKDCCKID